MKNFNLTGNKLHQCLKNERKRALAFLGALVVLGTTCLNNEALAIDLRNRTPYASSSSASKGAGVREDNLINIESKSVKLKKSSEEVDVIDIKAPKGNGISHNKFTDFSVGTGNGVIFNNSTVDGKSEIGGDIQKNTNLKKGANVILTEVKGNTPSNLNGTIEVFGDKADFILANENGITVNNGSFINTAGVTLTTGKVSLNGSRVNFDIQNGQVTLNATESDGDYFNVLAKYIEVQGKVSAKDSNINLIAGENILEGSSKSLGNINVLSSKDELRGNHGIYGSELGFMYGKNVRLLSTGSGYGVRHAGLTFSSEDMIINSKGEMFLRSVESLGNLEISGENVVLENKNKTSNEKGNISAVKDITINATYNIANSGKISGNGNITMSGEEIFNKENSSILAGNDLILTAKETIVNKEGSTIEAKGQKKLNAPTIK